MTNGFYLIHSEQELNEYKGLLARIDGSRCALTSAFINTLADKFNFPDYYHDNLDSLEEILNDLSWLENEEFGIYISNYDAFLETESKERKAEVINLLYAVAENWANVPNYPGEEEFRQKASFIIFIEKTEHPIPEIEKLLG